MRAFVARRASDIFRRGFAPTGGRLVTMESDVLFSIKQIQTRGFDSGQALEVTARGRVHVEAANAAEAGMQIAYLRAPVIESLGSAASSAEAVKVSDFYVFDHGRYISINLFNCPNLFLTLTALYFLKFPVTMNSLSCIRTAIAVQENLRSWRSELLN
jgi:hypothetical protein